ncbi:AfsR/SARP family transcriptional regulator [Streptomyces enissocaesilis]|uniref:OmpR/PhoB-type domain-containing protein n=1 Tax=Streptomyces enissocaesilis TaxID=332589 RepID=A0ABP6K8B9_9ACTN
MHDIAIKLLGTFEVESRGQAVVIPTGRQRTLLSALALEAGRTVSTERIAEHLWGTEPPPSSLTTIRGYILRLRRALAPHDAEKALSVIGSGGEGYRLQLAPESVDVHRFSGLVARAATVGDPDTEADLLRRALSLWRGAALCDVAGDMLRHETVPVLEEQRLQALQRSIDLGLSRGEHAEAAVILRQLVIEYPLRDGFWGQLMLALYGAGHQSEAMLQYERCRETLAESLGVDPDPWVRELHQRMLVNDPALSTVRRPAPLLSTPEKPEEGGDETGVTSRTRLGRLPPLLPTQHALFVGRDEELAALSKIAAEASGAGRLILMDGAAGVGKTALALSWAHRTKAEFPAGRFYLDLRGFGPTEALNPPDALQSLLTAIGVPVAHLPADVPARRALLDARLEGERVLVVLDNAINAEQVRPLLTRQATVLVTSRNQMRGLVVTEGARRLTLDRLHPVTARELLIGLIGTERCLAEPEALGDLASLCGDSPLVLRTVAETATRWSGLPLEELAAGIRSDPCWISSFGTGEDRTDPVSVLKWSYDALAPGPAQLYRLLGTHRGRRVTAASAAGLTGVPVCTAAEQLDALARLHLVEERFPGWFDIDELPRAFACLLSRNGDLPGNQRRYRDTAEYCQ